MHLRNLKINREAARDFSFIHNKKYLILFIFIYFLLGIGLTYSYFAYQVQNDSVIAGNVIAIDADLKVELVVGNNNGMVPMMDDALSNALNGVGSTNGACIDANGNLSCQVYKITLTNNGSILKNLKGTIELSAKAGASNAYSNLKWTEITNPTTLKEGAPINGMSKSTLVSNLTMASKEEKVWYIAVWISEVDADQTNTDKGEFQGTVTFETVTNEPNIFAETIMEPNAQSDESIDFSQASSSSGTNGIYVRSGTESDPYPIYYYRGNVNNNLIFADTCWKVVRTTETGGLKLIYNGVPNNVPSSINTITQSQYINVTNDATYPYTYDTGTNQWTSSNHTNSATGTIQFSLQNSGHYYLEYTVSSENNYDFAKFYVDDVQKGSFSGATEGTIDLGELTSNNVIKVEYIKDSSSSSGSDNVIFSVEIGSEATVTSCNNTGEASQFVTKAFNSNDDSPAYVGYMYSTPYTYSSELMSGIGDTYCYGNSVTYSGGTYTLVDTIYSNDWSSIYNGGLNNNHYTCFNRETTCSSVYYIFYTTSGYAYYITLTNGKTVEDALVDMLGADDENTANYNTTSSTIKGNSTTSGTLDYWYYSNILQAGYSNYIEDTVWCNDRSIYELNGWNPNGGSTRAALLFGAYGRAFSTYTPSLTCSRDIDKFTVSTETGNGDLDYPVGLLTTDEVMLAGATRSSESINYYLNNSEYYWLGSPTRFTRGEDGLAQGSRVIYNGCISPYYVNSSYDGVRPSISLKPGFTLTGDGDGTVNNPYIVE